MKLAVLNTELQLSLDHEEGSTPSNEYLEGVANLSPGFELARTLGRFEE